MTNLTRLRGPLTLALGLTAAFALASCGQTGSAPTTSTPTSVATTPSAGPSTSASPSTAHSGEHGMAHTTAPSKPTGNRIEVNVKGKQVTPAPATVNLGVGQSLTIAVTSDHDDTLHAHGFEVSKEIKAGQQATVTIKGAQPGVYEFELHNPALRLFQVAVR